MRCSTSVTWIEAVKHVIPVFDHPVGAIHDASSVPGSFVAFEHRPADDLLPGQPLVRGEGVECPLESVVGA